MKHSVLQYNKPLPSRQQTKIKKNKKSEKNLKITTPTTIDCPDTKYFPTIEFT